MARYRGSEPTKNDAEFWLFHLTCCKKGIRGTWYMRGSSESFYSLGVIFVYLLLALGQFLFIFYWMWYHLYLSFIGFGVISVYLYLDLVSFFVYLLLDLGALLFIFYWICLFLFIFCWISGRFCLYLIGFGVVFAYLLLDLGQFLFIFYLSAPPPLQFTKGTGRSRSWFPDRSRIDPR